jgi:hypothetical protein
MLGPQWLRSRARFWKNAALHSWGWIVLLFWTLFSNAATVRDNFLSPEAQQGWRTLELLPNWGWEIWVIGVLSILLLTAMEGAYRKWEKEHLRVVELTEDTNVTFAVHSIPRHWQSGQLRFLIVPEVTIINHSHGKIVTVDTALDMFGIGGFQAVCLPDNHGLEEWERSAEQSGLHVLSFPARVEPQGVAKGYIAFRPPLHLGATNFSSLRSQTGGVRCRIQFTDCHSTQILYEQEVEFHGI